MEKFCKSCDDQRKENCALPSLQLKIVNLLHLTLAPIIDGLSQAKTDKEIDEGHPQPSSQDEAHEYIRVTRQAVQDCIAAHCDQSRQLEAEI